MMKILGYLVGFFKFYFIGTLDDYREARDWWLR